MIHNGIRLVDLPFRCAGRASELRPACHNADRVGSPPRGVAVKRDIGRRLVFLRHGLVALALPFLLATACGDDPTPTGARSTPPPDDSTSTIEAPPDASVTAPPTNTSAAPPATLRCETVGFTPNSEDAASEITAAGLSCDEAEAFVRIAGERTSSGGPDRLDVSGYRCVRTDTEQDPLPLSRYECTNGDKTVTFVRS